MTRRERFRDNLNSLYIPIYDGLCSILPPRWQPYSGFRSFEEQKKLYDQGRVTRGPIVTQAGPGTSPHNYGCASDWTLFDVSGKPIWLEAGDPAWQEYSDACAKAGSRWGIKVNKGIDSPHNELPISCTWHEVYDVYLTSESGMGDALKMIANHRINLQ